jgi:hypothetical protein
MLWLIAGLALGLGSTCTWQTRLDEQAEAMWLLSTVGSRIATRVTSEMPCRLRDAIAPNEALASPCIYPLPGGAAKSVSVVPSSSRATAKREDLEAESSCAALLGAAEARRTRFAYRIDWPSSSSAVATAIGDLDGDGRAQVLRLRVGAFTTPSGECKATVWASEIHSSRDSH